MGRPFAPSWVDILSERIEALPGPAWFAYVALSVFAVGVVNVQAWAAGLEPRLSIDPRQSTFAFWIVYPLALVHYLDHAAGRAWEAFRPALDVEPAEAERIRYHLTTVPARPAALLAVVAVGVTVLQWVSDPVGQQVAGTPFAPLALRTVVESLSVGVVFVLMFQMYRQLGLVSELHARATRVDLFRPGPLYAFSGLTVRTGIGIIAMAVWQVVTVGLEASFAVVSLLLLGLLVGVGGAAFVLPLQGMHVRLAAEKTRLLDAANARLTVTIERLHAAVDSGELSTADQLNKTLASLVQERELLARLRTWPWAPATLGVFASAVALPIGLWLTTRLLERVI